MMFLSIFFRNNATMSIEVSICKSIGELPIIHVVAKVSFLLFRQ